MNVGIQREAFLWDSITVDIVKFIWKKVIGEGRMVGVILLDLKRTFEIVDREILLNKLKLLFDYKILYWNGLGVIWKNAKVKFNGFPWIS